jgi:hypothetical protein
MNPIDDQLNRLFRAARKTDATEFSPSFGLETRALAVWRESRQNAGSAGIFDMGILARGLVVAILIMGASLLPALQKTTTDPFSDYVQASDNSTTLASDDTQ